MYIRSLFHHRSLLSAHQYQVIANYLGEIVAVSIHVFPTAAGQFSLHSYFNPFGNHLFYNGNASISEAHLVPVGHFNSFAPLIDIIFRGSQ